MKRMIHSRSIGALTLCLFLCGVPGASRADFLDAEVGARGIAMGGAFVAVNGDPASLFWNPAATLSDRKVQVAGMRTRFFDGIDGFTEDFLGATFQVRDDAALAVGWTRTGLGDLYHEDVVSFGAAWRLPQLPLQVGASALFYGADSPAYEELNDPSYLGRQWKRSASIGLLYEVSPKLSLGASFENLFTPEMALLSTTTNVDEIGGRRRMGLAYILQEIVRFTVEVRHHDFPRYYDRDWTLHGGAESWFNDVLALRVGVDDGDLTAGAGVVVRQIRLDAGMLTNERLGNTFRIAVTVGY